jgi:hypothetical protein
MVKNRYYLDETARYYALIELRERKVIDTNSEEVLKQDCLSKLETLKEKSISEYILQINPFLIFLGAIVIVVKYVYSLLQHSPDTNLLLIIVFFMLGTILSGLYSYLHLRIIKKNKASQIFTLESILKELNLNNT